MKQNVIILFTTTKHVGRWRLKRNLHQQTCTALDTHPHPPVDLPQLAHNKKHSGSNESKQGAGYLSTLAKTTLICHTIVQTDETLLLLLLLLPLAQNTPGRV